MEERRNIKTRMEKRFKNLSSIFKANNTFFPGYIWMLNTLPVLQDIIHSLEHKPIEPYSWQRQLLHCPLPLPQQLLHQVPELHPQPHLQAALPRLALTDPPEW